MAGAPPTTTLSMLDHANFHRSWYTQFEELLFSLEINTSGYHVIRDHHFCFQYTHDLSRLSRAFLSITVSSGLRYKIDIDDIQIDEQDTPAQRCLTELKKYANNALSWARVSVFVHTCMNPQTQSSRI
ncbi:hypothetical protein OG21DRAFT_145866 [Imleria badia]|nr:hypothetical protein OG21DRAFT_145866 [Imleria badia]